MTIWQSKFIIKGIKESFIKLNPFTLWRNVVMFVVEIGSIITTVVTVMIYDQGTGICPEPPGIDLALGDRAVRQLRRGTGRNTGQGPGASRCRSTRNQLNGDQGPGRRHHWKQYPPGALKRNDVIIIKEGETIPGDGDIIEGTALVDESAITGESAPVIRESGGDRCGVTGGTKVLSGNDHGQDHGQSRGDLSRQHDQNGRKRETAEDAERDRPRDSAHQPHDPFHRGRRHPARLRRYMGITTTSPDPGVAPGVPHAHDHRRPPAGHRDRGHGQAPAAQRHRHERQGRGGLRRREHGAAGQDRDHHPRQQDGDGIHPRRRAWTRNISCESALYSSLADETPEGRSIVVLAKKELGIHGSDIRQPEGSVFIPFTPESGMSGIDMKDKKIRKGSLKAIEDYLYGNSIPQSRRT